MCSICDDNRSLGYMHAKGIAGSTTVWCVYCGGNHAVVNAGRHKCYRIKA